LARLKERQEELKRASAQKDSVLVILVQSINAINDNLEQVKVKQGIVTLNVRGDFETGATQRENIISNIQLINELMDENRSHLAALKKRVGALTRELEEAGMKMEEFEKMIATLAQTIENKDQEIYALKNDLASLNISMDSLVLAYNDKSRIADIQEEKINTAYYCFGTFKELKEKGVLTKEGGFIGIGRTEKLMEDFNRKYFTSIDITQTDEIDLYVDRVKMVTTHPAGSYKYIPTEDGKVKALIIMEPVEFWSVSKYLVMMVE
jgi:archaellum component FlaC